MRPLFVVWVLTLAWSWAWSNHALADPQSKSFSRWNISTDAVEARYRIPSREVTRLPDYANNPDLAAVLSDHLDRHIDVLDENGPCSYLGASPGAAEDGYLKVIQRWQCPTGSTQLHIRISAMFSAAPNHIHFARFRLQGETAFEHLFSRRQLQQTIHVGANAQQVASSLYDTIAVYVQFGFEHILIGLDHIAFLLALLLLAQRLRDVVFIVTGFTLGHSLTLSLTVLGMTTPSLMVVEAFIGFTIAFAAIENVSSANGRSMQAATAVSCCLLVLALLAQVYLPGATSLSLLGLALFSFCYLRLAHSSERARQMRPAITLLFGLIHGFGFASVLAEVGLPANAVVPALVGFNLGVELGQLAIVAALAGLGWGLKKLFASYQLLAVNLMNAGLCALGSYWFIQRLF